MKAFRRCPLPLAASRVGDLLCVNKLWGLSLPGHCYDSCWVTSLSLLDCGCLYAAITANVVHVVAVLCFV